MNCVNIEQMVNSFAARDTGINDPNFLWILLIQLIGAALIFIIGSLGIYMLLGRLRPKTNRTSKVILTLIFAIILVCGAGIISEQFDK